MPDPAHRRSPQVVATFVAFATFGSFWGAWGASIPRIRDQSGVDEGELGLALLCVGLGALPAMLLVGRALDRWGLRIAAWTIAALGLAGVGVTLGATSFATLAAGLVVVGISSGAADVAMNAVAGRAEQDAGRPIITRAHGMLSGFVVLGSVGTAAVAALELPLVIPFLVVGAMSLVAATTMLRALPARPQAAEADADADVAAAGHRAGLRGAATVPLLLVGTLGALAFATESAQQNWSAIFARDVLDAGHGQAALAPALFAVVVSATRLSIGSLGAAHAAPVLVVGGIAAAAGSLIVAAAEGTAVFALGLVVAAAGSAVLFPTVLGIVSRTVAESRRGRATSIVTTVAYLGFLLGPAYVGAWADAYDLRVAMVAVAALAGALALLTPALLRGAGVRSARERAGTA